MITIFLSGVPLNQKHPSTLLNNLYKMKSHQGANSEYAAILFLDRDANWAINIEQMELFNLLKQTIN